MTGKEHMIIGTTATATMGLGFLVTKTFDSPMYLIPLVFGGFVGSYMPDIDSEKSNAAQVFNKFFSTLILILAISYFFGLLVSIEDFMDWIVINKNNENLIGVLVFSVCTILGKLSPHRMFTHKILGTFLFCMSVFYIGNTYLALGFTMGYILHIVCDRFTKKGKYLNFFELKLPCKNSKNKTVISW